MRLQEPLNSKNLTLLQLNVNDVSNKYLTWLNDADVTKFMEVRHNPPNLEQQIKFVEDCLNSDDKILLGIFENKNGFIGTLKLTYIDNSNLEVGIMIGEKLFHGKGIGSESINVIISWAKSHNLLALHAGYDLRNIASRRLFESLGFSRLNQIKLSPSKQNSIIIERVVLPLNKL
jgi:ribosomal-protein-alanine N-acetyltransferase